ncbi:hypothetical protein P355_5379 [Burkholderia cenocepacia KC-01]|nr:hypothetical protein P355_5379 [Burkholderia cenocepacia KC-01]
MELDRKSGRTTATQQPPEQGKSRRPAMRGPPSRAPGGAP